jgi:O-antigen ligase
MFIGVLAIDNYDRMRLAAAVLMATLCSLVLATAQTVSGTDKLFPWATTDVGSVVGFFANRNHLATLCLIAMPFVGAFIGRAIRHRGADRDVMVGLGALIIALLIVALGVIRSRAGVALAIPTLLATLAVIYSASDRGHPPRLLAVIAVVIGLGLTAICVFALGPILERFDAGGSNESRFENWPVILNVSQDYLPIGSGIGSFDPVYRSVEPLSRLDPTYLNQAHNEYLEIILETGWLGAALLGAFLVWFARRSWAAWRERQSTLRDLQIAATVAITAVLAHSFVDYPLRTATLATVFALCCAFLEIGSGAHARRRTSAD